MYVIYIVAMNLSRFKTTECPLCLINTNKGLVSGFSTILLHAAFYPLKNRVALCTFVNPFTSISHSCVILGMSTSQW